MTDHDAPGEGADPGERLRLLARALEPAVALPGPDAARRRGERRRARARAGAAAASVAVLAAVTAGVWQYGPWRSAPEPAPPATGQVSVPPPPSTGLPWDDRFHWRETDRDGALGATYAGWRDRCAWSGFLTETGQGSVRYYVGRDGALAVWETVSYGSAREARKTAERLLDEGVCGYGVRTAGAAGDGPGVADTGGRPGEPGSARLYTVVDGDRLGVLRVLIGPPGEEGATAGTYPYAPPPDDGTADCLAGLLDGAGETTACRTGGGP